MTGNIAPIEQTKSRTREQPTNSYSAMLKAIREWLQNDHPEAEYATLVVELPDDQTIQIPVIPCVVTS